MKPELNHCDYCKAQIKKGEKIICACYGENYKKKKYE